MLSRYIYRLVLRWVVWEVVLYRVMVCFVLCYISWRRIVLRRGGFDSVLLKRFLHALRCDAVCKGCVASCTAICRSMRCCDVACDRVVYDVLPTRAMQHRAEQQWNALLCRATICDVTLWDALLCTVMLCFAVLCYTMPRLALQHLK